MSRSQPLKAGYDNHNLWLHVLGLVHRMSPTGMIQLSMRTPIVNEIRFQLGGNSRTGHIDRHGCLDKSISTGVLSMWLQTVKFILKKSKCAGLAQEIGFSAPNLWSLPWLVKGSPQLYTSKIGFSAPNLWSLLWLVKGSPQLYTSKKM